MNCHQELMGWINGIEILMEAQDGKCQIGPVYVAEEQQRQYTVGWTGHYDKILMRLASRYPVAVSFVAESLRECERSRGEGFWPALYRLKRRVQALAELVAESEAATDSGDLYVVRCREHLAAHPSDKNLKPDQLLKKIRGRGKAVREALRKLEERGEYSGFSRPK